MNGPFSPALRSFDMPPFGWLLRIRVFIWGNIKSLMLRRELCERLEACATHSVLSHDH